MGEKLPFEALRPAEKPTLDERLRTCDTLIRSQARELTQLQQTLRDGKDDSVLLSQHLKDLLTHSDLDNHQGQGFRESLLEGHWLAEHLAYKLSPAWKCRRLKRRNCLRNPRMNPYSDDKFAFDEPEVGLGLDGACGCSHAKEDEIQPISQLSRKILPATSLTGMENLHDEETVGFALDGACGFSHAKEDEMPIDLPENQNDHDDLRGPKAIALRLGR
ncbi:hypothetical protein Celaphus_00002100 [Cervus elaphus hippelaphus]|uniref:Uncharacterized protein n=1 Tax=Cervus elaphus hippelaphus TaxID=46360 RepID=A0A212CHX6_CEREH|nr:hypothetical protein Celaphus_00002100 [Cervus elaphus hippelaphus]